MVGLPGGFLIFCSWADYRAFLLFLAPQGYFCPPPKTRLGGKISKIPSVVPPFIPKRASMQNFIFVASVGWAESGVGTKTYFAFSNLKIQGIIPGFFSVIRLNRPSARQSGSVTLTFELNNVRKLTTFFQLRVCLLELNRCTCQDFKDEVQGGSRCTSTWKSVFFTHDENGGGEKHVRFGIMLGEKIRLCKKSVFFLGVKTELNTSYIL